MNEPQREVCWACFTAIREREPFPIEHSPSAAIPITLRKELSPGERLLWHGRPLDKLDLRNIPLIALPLTWIAGAGMIWIGGTLLHIFKASWSGGLATLPFGIIFAVAGVYVLFGPFLQRVLRRGSFYAITDRRVIIVHERPLHHVIARDVTEISAARIINETFEGVGDIQLSFNVLTSANSNLEYIENVQEAAGILRLARKQADPAAAGTLAGDAPASIARIVVPLHYAVIGLYALLVVSDTAEIFQTRGKVMAHWTLHREAGGLPPWMFYFIAPVMMYLFHVWARRFKTGTRAARKVEVAIMAGFAVLGIVLLFWNGPLSAPKTVIYVALGVFALASTTGRRI